LELTLENKIKIKKEKKRKADVKPLVEPREQPFHNVLRTRRFDTCISPSSTHVILSTLIIL